MKKEYMAPQVECIVMCAEQSVMIDASSTVVRGGSKALTDERDTRRDWGNIWNK